MLLGVYHVFRYAAAQCLGAGCDVYIPLSLLLPLLSWLAALVTGSLASLDARAAGVLSMPHHSSWLLLLTACTVLGFVGPLAALVVLRDKPDLFVLIGTTLVAIVPISALGYSVLKGRYR